MLQSVVGLRQRLRLVVVDHLQAVLDPPQQEVAVPQRGRLSRQDVVFAVEGLQHGQQPRAPQAAVAAPVGELVHVHEELDLADAPPPQLDVVARGSHGAVAVEVVDLLAHRADLLDRGEVEPLVPDERRQPLEEGRAGGQVAGNGAGLDEGGALPGAAEAEVVVEGEVHGDGRGGRGGVGAQAEVGAEDVAVAGAGLEDAGQVARDPQEAVALALAAGVAHPGRVVEDDEIDVGGVVQLAGAVLAEGEDEVSPAPVGGSGLVPLRGLEVAAFDPAQQEVRDRQAHGVVGHVRQQFRALHDAADAEAVVDRGGDGNAAALAPQEPHEPVAVHGRVRGGELTEKLPGDRLRGLLHQRLGELQVAQQEAAEVGAVAAEEGEEDPALVGLQGRGEGFAGGAGGRLPQPVDPGRGLVRPVPPAGRETPGHRPRLPGRSTTARPSSSPRAALQME